MDAVNLIERIRGILPENTVGRYDLLPIFREVSLFEDIIAFLAAPYREKIDAVVSPEALGWILGVAVARELRVSFIPIRKSGKLPYPNEHLISHIYRDYSSEDKELQIPKDALPIGYRVLIVDEWIETGATAECCVKLLCEADCKIVGIATIGIDHNDLTGEWIASGFVRFIGKDI